MRRYRYFGLLLALSCGDSAGGDEGGTATSGPTGTGTGGPGSSPTGDTVDTSDATTEDPPPTTGDPTGDTETTGGPPGGDDPVPEAFRVCDDGPTGATLNADSSNYLEQLGAMNPGDLLVLAAGTYDGGLPITDMNGSEGSCFFIEGPAGDPRAVFLGSDSRNTVSVRDSSYVVIRNLELDGAGLVGDAVKAEGTATYAHHIQLENLFIHDHDNNQQIVGISTKCTAWNWLIRGNWIETAGTGMYLGDSTGDAPFIAGLIENNVVLDTVGYNAQIKHQNPRPDLPDLPTDAQETIIRHNVFSKQNGASGGGDARPNLLLGHFPLSGAGMEDTYLVYGNFFFDNPVEALMQAEGNLAIYDNVFVNPSGTALNIQAHNDVPRRVAVFSNTVVATGSGIGVFSGDAAFSQRVVGNAVFADPAISADNVASNIEGTYAEASASLMDPTGDPPDLHPQDGALSSDVDLSEFADFMRYDADFDRAPRDGTIAGAYVGASGWTLARDFKP